MHCGPRCSSAPFACTRPSLVNSSVAMAGTVPLSMGVGIVLISVVDYRLVYVANGVVLAAVGIYLWFWNRMQSNITGRFGGREPTDFPAVIGVPHPDFGEAVVAVVKRAGGGPEVTADAIQAAAKAALANFKVPKKVFFVEELPRNTMGKVQKNLLRDRFKDSFSSAA